MGFWKCQSSGRRRGVCSTEVGKALIEDIALALRRSFRGLHLVPHATHVAVTLKSIV
jgi:hypothetical protein